MYDSTAELVREFSPELVLGFDPLAEDAVDARPRVVVVTRKAAAWTRNGEVPFTKAGTQSTIGNDPMLPSTSPLQSPEMVPCFDLAALIAALPGEIILKLDVEGAEIKLLRHLHRRGTDEHLALVVVEEHPDLPTYSKLPKLSCPVQEWWL